MGSCLSASPKPTQTLGVDSHEQLVQKTNFTIDEVYALEELFNRVSNSLHRDGLIHRDEFSLAMFNSDGSNIFAKKVFELFDIKKNDVIDFEEFVRALSVFHPKAPLDEKAAFAFRIYDLENTGFIERDEVKHFLLALLVDNPAIDLSEHELEELINQTFEEADLAKDGHISPEEWQILVANNPSIINYMTLPTLCHLTTSFPSFIFNDSRQ